jgi:hypothetical protein
MVYVYLSDDLKTPAIRLRVRVRARVRVRIRVKWYLR